MVRLRGVGGSHLQSQVKSRRQMMVSVPLILVWISHFCCDVIVRHNVKVAVIGRLLI